MKDSTKKLLNKQIAIMVKELEQIDDIKDRLELRVKVAQVIYNIGSHSDLEMPQGKDSIREDKAKEPVVVVEDDDIDTSTLTTDFTASLYNSTLSVLRSTN